MSRISNGVKIKEGRGKPRNTTSTAAIVSIQKGKRTPISACRRYLASLFGAAKETVEVDIRGKHFHESR